MADFPENTDTSTGNDQEVSNFPKFGDGLGGESRITAKNVADEAGRLFEYYEKRFKEYGPYLKGLDQKVTDQEKELKIARTDNAKSLAVFVAFFTFVSISFSILPRVSNPLVLLGILLVLLGSLTFFVLLLAWIMDIQREKLFTGKQKAVGTLAIILFAGGFASAYMGYQDMKNNDFYTQSEMKTLLNDQKVLLESKIQDGENYADMALTQFKVCIATRGLGTCLAE